MVERTFEDSASHRNLEVTYSVNTVFLPVLFLLFAIHPVMSQKYVLIEKAGNPRTERIAMYDDLTFQLRNDKAGWSTRRILDMNPDGQMIMLGDTWIQIKDIEKIKLNRRRTLPTILGGALQVGGISMFMGDLGFTISGDPEFSEGGMEFGLLNFAVGTGIRLLFEPIVYNLGRQKRLRVVDLTF